MSRPQSVGFARAANTPTPEQAWSSLAPLLAARGRMRVSRDGGRSYAARGERLVTDELPNQPSAVLLFDKTGCAPVICLDLDSSRGDVERDLATLSTLLRRFRVRWFSDSSPNGGRHVYIPLAEPAPYAEARAFVLALRRSIPTLDPQPMLNIAAGCLRPPGARHRSGGHQLLDGSIAAAVDVLRSPASSIAWNRLLADVTHGFEEHQDEDDQDDEQADQPATPALRGDSDEPSLEALHGYRTPDPSFTAIARTGDYPASRYKTRSHARQSVIWACVASGWTLTDVVRRIEDGTWPGLASLYAKYAHKHRRKTLVAEWRKAVDFEARRRQRANHTRGTRSVRVRTTSPHQTHAGAPKGVTGSATASSPAAPSSLTINQEVRVWLAAVDFLSPVLDVGTKAVLYALAEAAVLTDRLEVEHGNRSLAIATGLDQSTVGRILKELREAPADRALVDLIRPADRTRAHTYSLVVPALLRPAAERKPWRRGRIHAIRPVFRELGMVAAFIYGGLEIATEPLSGRDLAKRVGVGHTAAYDALAVLAAWGLAESTKAGWVIGTASPDRLAEQLGCDEQVAAQVARYRAERLAWWRYLGVVVVAPVIPITADPQVDRDDRAPPSLSHHDGDLGNLRAAADQRAQQQALDLLTRELGAVMIGVEAVPGIGYRNR